MDSNFSKQVQKRITKETNKVFKKMQNFINWSFFHKISIMLLGGMWNNYSVMELLQILTHELLINDSDKFFKTSSIL